MSMSKQGNDFFVHPSACVDEGAVIGAKTQIWHFSHIRGTAVIGEGCNIGQNVYVDAGVRIGNGVKIQNNVSVYEGVTLEDEVFCGPSMVFTNVINPRSHVSRKHEFKDTLVKRRATLGANCTIVCGNQIGEYGFVGAGAVVTKDVPPYGVILGVPGKLAGWICACGVRLDFKKKGGKVAKCSACGASYEQVGPELGVKPKSKKVQ
ncbi:MAG: acyltransferase [Pseudomonadota bacterium]